MKVLNVNMSLDPVSGGGTVERTIQLSKHLTHAGVSCKVLALDTSIDAQTIQNLRSSGVKIECLRCINRRFYIPELAIKRIEKIVDDNDVVHMMNHWTVINALVYSICRKLNKPYVVCPAGALPLFGRSRHLKKVYNLFIGKNILKNASGLISIPENEVKQFEAYGIRSENISVIPNGIDPDEFIAENDAAFRTRYILGNQPFILFVGRLNIIKGPDLLLHAFANLSDRFPHHQLVYAGPDDGMLPMLKDIAREKGVSNRVHFIGFIGGEKKSWAYHSTDLLVVPSRQEAMSIVAIEAGITGTPVLATDVCGLDQIERIGGGNVVSPTVDGLQEGLLVLQDTERLVKMGKTLKRYVKDNYTWDIIVGKHLDLFNRILGSA